MAGRRAGGARSAKIAIGAVHGRNGGMAGEPAGRKRQEQRRQSGRAGCAGGLSVEFRQNTIEQILESEYAAASSARQRYGKHYDNAQAISVYLTSFLESFDQSRWVFGSFIGEVKKHQVLSLLSAVRLHKVQAMMNLRQVVEAGACAAYAIANPDHNDFVDTDEHGILDPSQRLAKKRYKWLDENY